MKHDRNKYKKESCHFGVVKDLSIYKKGQNLHNILSTKLGTVTFKNSQLALLPELVLFP